MCEWRLDLLFKYAGNNLTRWRKIVGLPVQNNNGRWGIITYIGGSNIILDVDSKDIYIYLDKKRQFKDEMQRVLMKQRILRKEYDSQVIFWVCD